MKLIFLPFLALVSCEMEFTKQSHKLLDRVSEMEGRNSQEPSMIAICFVIEDMLVNDYIEIGTKRKTSIIKTCPTIKIKINYKKTNNNKLLHVTHGTALFLSTQSIMEPYT